MSVDRERRAYVCVNKAGEVIHRVFLHPGDEVPTCAEHGKMTRQANKPYKPQKGKR